MDSVRNLRFVASLVPAVVLLGAVFAVVILVAGRIGGGLGVVAGIVAGACLGLGTLLAYWIGVDWLNLQVVRMSHDAGDAALRDGELVAFEGVTRVAEDPLTSPFSAMPCAAYTYVVSASGHSSSRSRTVRVTLAQGFHMLDTRLEGAHRSLKLRSFPSFEDDLRESARGGDWGKQAGKLLERNFGTVPAANDRQRNARLLEVRDTELSEVHEDYCNNGNPSGSDGFTVEEEILPVDQSVCVVGTYDEQLGGLMAGVRRFGPNMMVYRGTAEEVLSRVGGETRKFAKIAVVLLGISALLVGTALLT